MTKSGTQGPIGRAKFSNFDFDHFFLRIEPFWVILSKKKFFEKFVEKWLSLEASKHCKGSVIQKSKKKILLQITQNGSIREKKWSKSKFENFALPLGPWVPDLVNFRRFSKMKI